MGRRAPHNAKKSISGRNLAVALFMLAIVGIVVFTAFRSATNQVRTAGVTAGASEQIILGQRIYQQQCAACHGANLEGQANWQKPLPDGSFPAPPHDSTGHTWHHGDEYLFAVTKLGGQATASSEQKNNMPAFGNRLSDDEIRAVLAYIKSTWPPEIQAAQAQQR